VFTPHSPEAPSVAMSEPADAERRYLGNAEGPAPSQEVTGPSCVSIRPRL